MKILNYQNTDLQVNFAFAAFMQMVVCGVVYFLKSIPMHYSKYNKEIIWCRVPPEISVNLYH